MIESSAAASTRAVGRMWVAMRDILAAADTDEDEDDEEEEEDVMVCVCA